jgi:hypothetical protein
VASSRGIRRSRWINRDPPSALQGEESDKGNEKKYHSAAILLLLLAKDGVL